MSHYVRQVDGELVLYERRPATEIGYEGPIITLPPRMAAAYNEAVDAILDDEDLGAPTVRMDFAVRRRRPVLVLRWEGQTKQVIVDDEGASKVVGRGSDSIEGHSNPIEWAEALTGSLAALTDEFIRYTAETSQWPESIGEAERRGLDPSELELDAEPIVEPPAQEEAIVAFDDGGNPVTSEGRKIGPGQPWPHQERLQRDPHEGITPERHRDDYDPGPTRRVGGTRMDVDDVPTRAEL